MSCSWPKQSFSSAPVEIIDGDRGKEYPKHSDFSDSGYCLFLNTGNVRPDGFDFSNCQFISEEKDQRLRKGKLMRHDLVMTTRGTIGNVGYYDDNLPYENVRINSGMVIFRVDASRLNPSFLFHFLRSPNFVGQTNTLRSGVAQPQFPIRDIRRVELSIPDLAIQKRIASILSTYDDLIENNRRRMALLEGATRQLYREWFVRLRFPGYEHTRITNGVPEGWRKVAIPEAVDINPPSRLSDEEEHWWVEMADLPTNSMVIQQTRRRSGRSGSKFQNGDTLLARITPCLENGKTGFVNFMTDGEVGRGSTEFIVFRSRLLTPQYVYCLARTYNLREHAIKSMVGASGRQRVQESCFEEFLVWVPPKHLLTLFDDFAVPAFSQVKMLHAQNQKLRSARDLLLPQLIGGEITV